MRHVVVVFSDFFLKRRSHVFQMLIKQWWGGSGGTTLPRNSYSFHLPFPRRRCQFFHQIERAILPHVDGTVTKASQNLLGNGNEASLKKNKRKPPQFECQTRLLKKCSKNTDENQCDVASQIQNVQFTKFLQIPHDGVVQSRRQHHVIVERHVVNGTTVSR